MKRKLMTLFLLLACALTSFAQEYRKSLLETLFETDTTYIEPQHYDWTVMGQGSFVFDRVSMDFGDGEKMILSSDPAFKLGPFAGYKFVFLGYTIDMKNFFKSKNRTDFVLGVYSNAFGLDVFYRKADGDFKIRKLGLDKEDEDAFPKNMSCSSFYTKYMGFDLYYVLNHKHYSMPAVFAQSTVQRKSAGSPTIGLGYMKTVLDLDEVEFLTDVLYQGTYYEVMKEKEELTEEDLESLKPGGSVYQLYRAIFEEIMDGEEVLRDAKYKSITAQLGYGYNWVFAHNWTLGAHVAINPALKFNKASIETIGHGSKTIRKTSFNLDYTARAGIVYNNTRWYAGANAIYYSNSFNMDQLKVRNNFGSVNLYVGINLGRRH